MDGLRVTVGQGGIQSAADMRETLTRNSELKTNDAQGGSFVDTLKEAINNVNSLQKVADTKMQELATGRSQNIHETMIATEKADLALRLMVQVRNKVIDAYQEIMKMQV